MSGTNPFRRKTSPSGDLAYAYTAVKADNPKGTPQFPTLVIDAPRSKKPKTVRIISPRSSTTDHDPTYREFPPAAYDRSLSSDSESGGDHEHASLIDPFDIESDDGGATSEEEEDKKVHHDSIEKVRSLSSRELLMANMPPNPFRKTLASQTETTDHVPRNVSRDFVPSISTASGTRPYYDVESFTRLLLTGEKNHSQATAIPIAPIPDSSSNTDASSISRQSIFEPLPENHQDTPRTSHEVSFSDDERQAPGSAPSPSKVKPLTPEHLHGRAVTESQLGASYPTVLIPVSAFSSEAPIKRSTSTSPRTPTDLNKPLPLPPNLQSSQQAASNAIDDITNQQDSSKSSHQQPQISRSPSTRIRPPPPVTRRYSQLRSDTLTRNLEQWTSISEEKIKELDRLPVPPSPSSSKLPPPPPPRRHGRNRGLSASSTSSSISIAGPPPATSSTEDTVPVSSKHRPSVPPARTPSSSSFKRPTRILTSPNSLSIAPPPAPPPRRRGSSQSSFSLPHPNGEDMAASADRPRTDSGNSVMLPPPPAALHSESGKKDVMADLSALQREVDELRRQFRDQ